MRWFVPALHALLLLALVPALEQPFTTPKLTILCAGAVAALVILPKTGQQAWLPLAWLCLASISTIVTHSPLLLDAGAALLLYALLTRRWQSTALPWLGALQAVIVLAQLVTAQRRLDLFGTLGNPDFVASWLTVSLLLTESLPLALIQIAALAVLGSWATALALVAALIVSKQRAIPAVALLAVLAGASQRDLLKRIDSRLALHAEALQHLNESPLGGRSFPGHVHDDWLERAIEKGWPASLLLAFLALSAVKAKRRQSAAVLAMAVRAFVDFPLERPAELALFVTLLAACLRKEAICTDLLPHSLPSSSPQPQPLPGAIA